MTADEILDDIARQVANLAGSIDKMVLIAHPRALAPLIKANSMIGDYGGQWLCYGLPVWRSLEVAGPVVVTERVANLLRAAPHTYKLPRSGHEVEGVGNLEREPDLLFF